MCRKVQGGICYGGSGAAVLLKNNFQKSEFIKENFNAGKNERFL